MIRWIVGMLILVLATSGDADAQERRVTGRVTSSQGGAPLAGASVEVVGTGRGAVTDPQGNFSVSAPQGPVTLRISLIGFRTRTVALDPGQSRVEVDLATDVLELEALVVTGQGTTVSRRNLATSIESVTSEELAEAPPAETVERMLQGRVPGANIEQNSGAPGGGVSVRLRGVSTIIGESEPLWVVDGVVMSNVAIANNLHAATEANSGAEDNAVNRAADLNPDDIASVEILKGASAAALYGSRAANGVILVTTKRGAPGETRVRMSQKVGFFETSELFPFREWTLDDALDRFAGRLGEDAVRGMFDAAGRPLFEGNQEALTDRRDLSWETSGSVSGGDDDTRYFLSGTWKDDAGIIENTGFEKQSVRLNVEQLFGGRVRAQTGLNLLRTDAARGVTNNDNTNISYWMALTATPEFFDLRRRSGAESFPVNPFTASNPLETAALAQSDEEVWRLMGSGRLEVDVLQGAAHRVSVNGTAGVDWFNQENDILFPPALQFEDDDGLRGTSLLGTASNRDVTLSANVVHGYTAPSWSSTFTAGVQYEDRALELAQIEAFNLTGGQPNVDAGTVKDVNETREEIRDLGFFAQEELLLLDDRLFLTVGARADRSSVNGDPDRYFFYPKASASYRVLAPFDGLDELKLRTAFGQSGNQPRYGQKFTSLVSTRNVAGIPGIVLGSVTGDPALEPERTTEIEGGLDLTLFGERALLSATVFQKDVEDLLLQRTPAPSTGFTTEVFNGGEMRVRGIELSLDATPVLTDAFSWTTRATFSRNYSKITDLPVPAFEAGSFDPTLGGVFQIEEGASATQIVVAKGVDADGAVIIEHGGDASPDYRLGFSNEIAWGGLTLYGLVDVSQGASVINLTQFLADIFRNSADYAEDPQDVEFLVPGENGAETFRAPNAGTGRARFLRAAVGLDARGYLEDAGYVKLREVTLGYRLPGSLVGSAFGGAVEGVTLRLTGRNLLTFTDYTGVDPEVSLFANDPIARNVDVAPFPPSRSFWFSVDLNF